nr:uncharacterized protein LOC126525127 [Dermacentor andersoni]
MLVGAGLQPVAVVCDQGNQNVSLFSKLVTPEKPYLSVIGEPLFFIFDPPHLLKCLRNMLLKYDFRVGSDTIKSSYIRQAYEKDREMQIRSIPKLSARHFNLTFASKMSVKLAAQVFSNHCAAALCTLVTFQQLPSEAIHTARFVERIDRLFDSLNTSQKRGKSPYASAICAGSVHEEFLEESIAVFENIEVLGCARQPLCIRGFCQTMRAVLLLWNHLASRYGLTYLLTWHLNQDALENTFAIVRSKSGSNTNSSCRQFQAAFRHLLVSNLFKLSESSNCAEDMSSLLATLPVRLSKSAPSLCTAATSLPVAVEVLPYDYQSPILENNIVYFAGWLAYKFMNDHRCVTGPHTCEVRLENAAFADQSQVLLYLSVKNPGEGDFGSLSVPTPSFVAFINACEQVFVASSSNIVGKEQVGHDLCMLLHAKVEKSLTVCGDDVYDGLFALFVRVRLHWLARRKNLELHSQTTKRKATKQALRLSK